MTTKQKFIITDWLAEHSIDVSEKDKEAISLIVASLNLRKEFRKSLMAEVSIYQSILSDIEYNIK